MTHSHLVIMVTSNEQICVAISNFLVIRYFTIYNSSIVKLFNLKPH